MKKTGFFWGQTYDTLFIEYSPGGKVIVLIVYADAIILTRDNIIEIDHLKKCLVVGFKIQDLRALRYFLGMEVAQSKRGPLFHNKNIFSNT